MARRGKPSPDELRRIDELIDQNYTNSQIARVVDRTTQMIENRRKLRPHTSLREESLDTREAELAKLHERPMWGRLKDQLTLQEQRYFEEQWILYCEQFAIQDISHSEEIQIKDLILSDILGDQSGSDIRGINDQILYYEKFVKEEFQKPLEGRDHDKIHDYKDTAMALRATIDTIEKKYKDHMDRKNSILKSLKATREQRLKVVQESKKNIFDLIKMLDKPEIRKAEGDDLLIFRMAIVNSREKLKQTTKYVDGTYDSPLLRPEDIKDVN